MKRFLVLFAALAATAAAETLDLAGAWRLALDPEDRGFAEGPVGTKFDDVIQLPGTLTRAGKGKPLDLTPALDKTTLAGLHQRFSYTGPAWYQRTVVIPADWQGQEVELSLERVLWESRLWVNGKEGGMADSLCVPHRYEIGGLLQPGENTLTLRIDNREKLPIGIGHAYTNATQTIWNGVVGQLTLTARPKVHVETPDLRPQRDGSVKISVRTSNRSGRPAAAQGTVTVRHPDGRVMPAVDLAYEIPVGDGVYPLTVSLAGDLARWSEFSTGKYRVDVKLRTAAGDSEASGTFGYRLVRKEGQQWFINDLPLFLRGTLECCIFPKTGHPDMTGTEWEKIFATAKAHGLNHLRFHSWCPPEAAFEAADRLGFYLQVELPNWSFKMGWLPAVDGFFKSEGERILREYGNHPSFVFFCLGNELTGDYTAMDRMVEDFRAIDPDKLFSSTAFSFSPRGKRAGPADDFFISQETTTGWVRGQGFLNTTRPNTAADYSAGLASVKVPLVTHEVGQYNSYPNLAELPKYEGGPLRAGGYEAIRNDLEKKGRLSDAPRLTRDSGKLAALLYKEDMERALRTRDLAGIQLLDLHDFPGQSTATVGILDAFWDSKGFITPEAFREFAGPVVLLARLPKMVWENTETLTARLEMANFGPAPLGISTVVWKLEDAAGAEVAGGRLPQTGVPLGNGIPLGSLAAPLSKIREASQLRLTVSLEGTAVRNSWPVWVYPVEPVETPPGFVVLDTPGAALTEALAAGKRVLLLPPQATLLAPLDARFIPVFWSPLHFPNQPGTLGATIDNKHPAFARFPTETYTTWQWWELFNTSYAMNLEALRPAPAMPLCFVDKFDRNALPAAVWEARSGAGVLLVCTLDITSDLENRPAARQLRRSLLTYLASDGFRPAVEVAPRVLAGLFREAGYGVSASSAHADYPAAAAADGKPDTFWHTDWTAGTARLPARLMLDLGREEALRGLRYTPRQNMNRGRVARYRIEVSRDRKTWVPVGGERQFADGRAVEEVLFAKPLKSRYLSIAILSDQAGSGDAAIAEMEALTAAPGDVKDLGIVPGFND